jgi:hypothetical protein
LRLQGGWKANEGEEQPTVQHERLLCKRTAITGRPSAFSSSEMLLADARLARDGCLRQNADPLWLRF